MILSYIYDVWGKHADTKFYYFFNYRKMALHFDITKYWNKEWNRKSAKKSTREDWAKQVSAGAIDAITQLSRT